MQTTTRSSASAARLTSPTYWTLRLAEHLDAVVPAVARVVVEPPPPLLEQVRPGELREPVEVARVPRALDLQVQLARAGADGVGGERRVVVGGDGRGELDLRAPARRAACDAPGADHAEHEHDQDDGEDHEDEDRAAGPRAAAAAEAAASAAEPAAASASAAPAEARAAAPRGGECGTRGREGQERGEQHETQAHTP